jgi:hypothetical protein
MRGGKGQVTMFFAVGLVLVLVVAITFLLLARIRDAAPVTLDTATNPALTSYVASCMDTVVGNELEEFGTTGGITYMPSDSAYGELLVEGGLRKVAYGITQNRRREGIDLLPPIRYFSAYPDKGVTIETSDYYDDNGTLKKIPSYLAGHFGEVQLPGVCAKTGPNGLGSKYLCRYYPGTPLGTRGANDSNASVQEVLVTRVRAGIKTCIDPNQFVQTTGRELTIQGDPFVNITFTPEAVLVGLDYNLALQGRSQITKAHFERSYPVRLLPMLEYAHDLAKEETRNVKFALSDPAQYSDRAVLSSYLEGFTVTEVRPIPLMNAYSKYFDFNSQGSMVVVSDSHSQLRGRPYAFVFLVENRRPVLNPVGDKACATVLAWDPDAGQQTPKVVNDMCTVVNDHVPGVNPLEGSDYEAG